MTDIVRSSGLTVGMTLERENYRKFSNKIRTAISDMSSFFANEADQVVRDWFREVFRTKGAILGRPWAPRTPTTLALYKSMGKKVNGDVGILSGRMRTALTRKNAAEATVTVDKTTYSRTIDVTANGAPYPKFFAGGWRSDQMFGKPKRPYAVPPRPLTVANMPPAFTNKLENAAQKWIAKRLSP
jgi:hypothetical protein